MSNNGGDLLLKECDHIYNVDLWETTYPSDMIYELSEEAGMRWDATGAIVQVGRLKQMAPVYAVNVPVSWSDGEADDFEVRVFKTREQAEASYKAAMASAPAELEPEGQAG
jgi:hypothetical protein